MKKFWSDTSVVAEGDQFTVFLDTKPLKMPGGGTLTVSFQPLAEAIAAEWRQSTPEFTLDDLPLTRLAATAQARVRLAQSEIIEQLAAYGMNDLLCYRAAAEPGLAAREAEIWQPWLDWAEQKLRVTLHITSGVIHIEQPPEARQAFIDQLSGMSEYQIAGLGVIVPALGSLVLGLAVEAGALQPEAACDCAHLDELWQEARWGADDEAIARRRAIALDVGLSARFMTLCRP